MKEFRLKQKRAKVLMNFVTIFGALFILIYIGVQPIILEKYGEIVTIITRYVCDLVILSVLGILFFYFSKYSKSDSFLKYIEYEIADAGHYYYSRNVVNEEEFEREVILDLEENSFIIQKKLAVDDFEFDFRASKKTSFIYGVKIPKVNREDIIAYTDLIITDLTLLRLKRKGDIVLMIITDEADESGIALSKMVTPIGKKEQIKITTAIVEPKGKKVYFLGNMESKCKTLIANYVMNCEIPIKEQYISKNKLPFQVHLEEKMKEFTLKAYLSGDFIAH